MKVFNRYNPKPLGVGLDFTGHDETCNQQLASECEIRNILTQFEQGSINDLPRVRPLTYKENIISPDVYLDALQMASKVKDEFYSLPVETQRQFGDIKTYVTDMFKLAQNDLNTVQKYDEQIVKQAQSQSGTVSQPEQVASIPEACE